MNQQTQISGHHLSGRCGGAASQRLEPDYAIAFGARWFALCSVRLAEPNPSFV